MIKKILYIITGVTLLNTVSAQSIMSDNSVFLASIDSNTIKLRNKLFPNVWQGDLNIYGFEENEVPVYSNEDIKTRLSLLESEIPLDYNEQVRPYIDLYTVRKRKLLAKVLTLSKLYFPTIEEIFDREGIPLEMKYLAVIESALNHAATSPVGAAGMWQFMAPTGHMYGLKTTNNLDERRDFIKSTEASVKYFKNSYRVYGDWLLVIASYNCGVGNVNKAIRKSGGKRNFWAIMPYLPRETRGYVPAFIAAAYAMNYASEHNIYPAELELNFHTDTIQVDNRYSLDQLSMALDIPLVELKTLNPSLKRGYIPFTGSKITLTLPYNKIIKFSAINNLENLNLADEQLVALANSKQKVKEVPETVFYKVKKGDLLASIANQYDVTVKQLKKWNRLKSSKVKKGQRLKIYTNKA
ncbi:MAG: transglycosylase SLT domain-containing protein, partial [Bacteroidia bacterium]|nr:transglycosylase SLT domain-containing protein [Bacteroidia bacterium]